MQVVAPRTAAIESPRFSTIVPSPRDPAKSEPRILGNLAPVMTRMSALYNTIQTMVLWYAIIGPIG
jgi:hypothetical protein